MTYIPNASIETYIPNPLVWTDTGISCATYFGKESSIIRIGSYLYSFGGNTGSNHNKIWIAPWNDSLNWVDYGATLPAAACGLRIMIIDGYIYAFGDQHKGTYIWRASVSNPVSWIDTGATLPASGGARYNAAYAVVSNKICIFQGDTELGGVPATTILTADISDPLTWSKVTVPGSPSFFTESVVAVMEDKAYLYGGYEGGYGSGYAIYEYRTNLTAVDKFDTRIQFAMRFSPETWHIGDGIWIIGGNNSYTITKMPAKNPNSYDSTHKVLPEMFSFDTGNLIFGSWIDINGYLYIPRANGHIYRSGRTKVYAEAIPTDGSNRGIRAVSEGGVLTSVTSSCRLGFKSWLTNRTDLLP